MILMEGIVMQNEQSNLDNYFVFKKLEVMIELNNKKVANELSNINKTISKLNEEISEIKKQLNGTNAQEKVIQPEKEHTNQNIGKAKNNELLIDPKEVSIEKFFYFGATKK